jgi:hypothetical protein
MKITEHDALTGETVERDATTEEIAQFESNEAANAQKAIEEDNKVIAKAALLEKLGITADEAKLLLA